MKVVVESSPGTTVKIIVMSSGVGSTNNPTSSSMTGPPLPRKATMTEQNIGAGASKRVRVQIGPSTSSAGTSY